MTERTSVRRSDRRGGRYEPVRRVLERTIQAGGREAWRVASDGHTRIIVTTNTSAAAMDEAMAIYGTALRRLADR